MNSCSVRSHLQPQRHFHETDDFTQNLRQKVVNKEALRLCGGGGLYVCAEGAWNSKLTKVALIYKVSYFNLGGIGALFGGDKPTKAPRGDGTGFISQLAPHSLSPVLCWEFSESWYIDWLIVLANLTQHVCDKVVLRRSSRRGNAVSRYNFSCEVREWHHVCKNFVGAIVRFARSWLRPWWLITSAIICNRGIYMFHWMLVAPQALKRVLPVEDSFSNKEMRTFSRIGAHQSASETFNTSLWKKKTKPASVKYFAIMVLATNKTCGTFLWQVSVFSVLWNIMFSKWLFITMSKRTCFIFQPIFPHFSGILADQRVQRPISLPQVIASAISSIVFFDYTSWRSSATALLVELGLFSSLHRSKSVTTYSSIFCRLSPLDFSARAK